MDTSLIKPHYCSLIPHSLPLPNVISSANHYRNDDEDIEMIDLESISYTSLKDLMPPSTASPTGSWREIPIKDPLLQHAAWAYLRPVAAERGEDGRWWRRFLDKCCCGLFLCFNGVVLMVFEGFFSGRVIIKVD